MGKTFGKGRKPRDRDTRRDQHSKGADRTNDVGLCSEHPDKRQRENRHLQPGEAGEWVEAILENNKFEAYYQVGGSRVFRASFALRSGGQNVSSAKLRRRKSFRQKNGLNLWNL